MSFMENSMSCFLLSPIKLNIRLLHYYSWNSFRKVKQKDQLWPLVDDNSAKLGIADNDSAEPLLTNFQLLQLTGVPHVTSVSH